MARLKSSTQFARNLGKNEILVPHLNNWFANGVFPDEIPFVIHPNKEDDDAFHPSSATLCSRALQAKLDGILPKQENRMESQKNFMFGHYSHALLQWVCVEQLGFAVWDDIEKDCDYYLLTDKGGNEYRVRGFPDIAKCTVPNVDPFLVDIKTCTAQLYGQSNLPPFLLEKYQAQVKIYLDFEGLDKGIILLVEKDSPHRFKEIVVERDDRYVSKTIARWESVVDARAEGNISPCTCDDPDSCPALNCYDTETKINLDKTQRTH